MNKPSKAAELVALLQSNAFLLPQVIELAKELESEWDYRYRPDALTLLRHSMQAIEDDFGPNDPAITKLQEIFCELKQRKVAA